jgi:two-component system, NarL family, sensor histidine kinase UhpB
VLLLRVRLRALQRVRAGDLAVRLPQFELPELSRLGVGFNHMAETLEKSVSENQRLTRELVNAQEKERRHLAHELHDEIAQCVSAIHADAVTIRRQGGTAVQESAEAIVQVVARIKESVRSMLRRIRPAYLAELGLETGIRQQVAAFRQRNPGVACALAVRGDLTGLDGEVGVTIYRVVQESLTNITVHADARNVSIELGVGRTAQVPDSTVDVTITDDGAGFFQLTSNRGLGLTGIRERARALGGSCSIASEPGKGTHIDVSVPFVRTHEMADV